MRRTAVTLALALIVIGCALVPQPTHDSSPSGAMAHMGTDPGDVLSGPNGTCVPNEWVTGVIVPGASGEATIKDDHGYVRRLTWGFHNPAVVDWNRRYTIGGGEFTGRDTFWACGGADSVIPQ